MLRPLSDPGCIGMLLADLLGIKFVHGYDRNEQWEACGGHDRTVICRAERDNLSLTRLDLVRRSQVAGRRLQVAGGRSQVASGWLLVGIAWLHGCLLSRMPSIQH
jgi:hypothetical protein